MCLIASRYLLVADRKWPLIGHFPYEVRLVDLLYLDHLMSPLNQVLDGIAANSRPASPHCNHERGNSVVDGDGLAKIDVAWANVDIFHLNHHDLTTMT